MITKPPLSIVRLSRAALVLLFVAWAPAGVAAVTATVTAGVHLRAGPDIVYPSVMMLPPAAVVQVFGCEQAYNWCDVQVGADRGWVDAAFLQAPAPSGAPGNRPLPTLAPRQARESVTVPADAHARLSGALSKGSCPPAAGP